MLFRRRNQIHADGGGGLPAADAVVVVDHVGVLAVAHLVDLPPVQRLRRTVVVGQRSLVVLRKNLAEGLHLYDYRNN